MTPDELRPVELSSWKELAAYLGVSVRTAQVWERERGLPIRRLPGGRGRISVEIAALEEWKNSRAVAEPVRPDGNGGYNGDGLSRDSLPSPVASRPAFRWRPWACGMGLLAAAALMFLLWPRHGNPCGYRIEPKRLVVLDRNDRPLWEKAFSDLNPATYQGRPLVAFADLDGSGYNSVLFVPASAGITAVTAPLICFDSRGRERWRFTSGRAVHTATEAFDPLFSIQGVVAAPLGATQAMRVVVTSCHYLYYPTQIALLAPDGKLLGEYWHSGQLNSLVVKDGAVLFAGVHNPSKQATLTRLTIDQFHGASVERNPAYQLQGFPPATEDARLFFPRSCINQRFGPFLVVRRLWASKDGVTVQIDHHITGPQASIFYHLNNDLTLRNIGIASDFEADHLLQRKRNELDHDWSNQEEEALRNITYLPALAPVTQARRN